MSDKLFYSNLWMDDCISSYVTVFFAKHFPHFGSGNPAFLRAQWKHLVVLKMCRLQLWNTSRFASRWQHTVDGYLIYDHFLSKLVHLTAVSRRLVESKESQKGKINLTQTSSIFFLCRKRAKARKERRNRRTAAVKMKEVSFHLVGRCCIQTHEVWNKVCSLTSNGLMFQDETKIICSSVGVKWSLEEHYTVSVFTDKNSQQKQEISVRKN